MLKGIRIEISSSQIACKDRVRPFRAYLLCASVESPCEFAPALSVSRVLQINHRHIQFSSISHPHQNKPGVARITSRDEGTTTFTLYLRPPSRRACANRLTCIAVCSMTVASVGPAREPCNPLPGTHPA